jgi:hypothetical protein
MSDKAMRDSLYAALEKHKEGQSLSTSYVHGYGNGFQAAYRPKPDVEVVARRVYDAKYPNHPRAEIPQAYLNEVRNVINAIFKEQI